MSKCSLIDWFEQLLFGTKATCLLEPPPEAFLTVAKLNAERVDWKEMARLGGLTMHRYQIQCDFETIFDYLEKPGDTLPEMKTRTMTTFFNLMLAFIARQKTIHVEPSLDDKATLEQILSNPNASGPYHSASFWGELARQWLNNRRPVPKALEPLSAEKTDAGIRRLYDVTCYTRGRTIDPLSMHMVPDSEYVNAVHWKSASQLEAFVRVQPKHALSRAVNQLVIKSLHQFLDGRYPSCLADKDDKLQLFLKNVSVAHETVPEVYVAEPPPRLIDVFQRLLAQARYDDLWEKIPTETSVEYPYTQMMHMTEQLLLSEKQNQILLKHVCSN